VPQAYQHRQNERDDERIECVEKRRAADDNTHEVVPSGDRQPFNARYDCFW
jgi:hypothetical protein